MAFKNTPSQYGSVSKLLHWTIALIVIFQLVVGSWMHGLPRSDFKFKIYDLHKSLGILVLALIAVRVLWHLFSRRPQPVETLTKMERIGARALHDSFYLLLIAMPLTGWAMSSAFGVPVHVFGLFTLPDFVVKSKAGAHLYRELHGYISDVLIAVVSAHAGAALMHHFFKKDTVLKRMLPLLLAALLLGAAPAAKAATTNIPAKAATTNIPAKAAIVNVPAQTNIATAAKPARAWVMLHQKSTITFKPTQLGKAFTGHFGVFAASIFFSPDNLAGSSVYVDVHMTTASTGASDRDQNLMSAEWFDVARFPDAIFKSTAFHKVGANAYTADGILTIKGVSLPVQLPFTVIFSRNPDGGEIATADGSLTLDRSKFNIGTGQWKATDIIASQVPVFFHIVALGAKQHT